MTRFISVLLSLGAAVTLTRGAEDVAASIAGIKQSHPPRPEAHGLRLEVDARLENSMSGAGGDFSWEMSFLVVEVALHNISNGPITVPTTAYDPSPQVTRWPGWGPGLERIRFTIESPKFRGKPVAFVAARFTPVTLAPGEYALLVRHTEAIKDRTHVDTVREASVSFVVSRSLAGPKDWWRGNLETYAPIRKDEKPEEFSARMKDVMEKAKARRDAEQDSSYGARNAAEVAAAIARADRVVVRGEIEEASQKEPEPESVIVDPRWIERVRAAISKTALPHAAVCFCTGWRTAYFYRRGELVVAVAAIHGNQLRIRKGGEVADYEIAAADWEVVKHAIDAPANPAPAAPAGKR